MASWRVFLEGGCVPVAVENEQEHTVLCNARVGFMWNGGVMAQARPLWHLADGGTRGCRDGHLSFPCSASLPLSSAMDIGD